MKDENCKKKVCFAKNKKFVCVIYIEKHVF